MTRTNMVQHAFSDVTTDLNWLGTMFLNAITLEDIQAPFHNASVSFISTALFIIK